MNQQTTRRKFINLVGGGAVLAALPLTTSCSSMPPESTLQAWEAPMANLGTREFMLAHALLAPNPHNRQPWLADLSKPNEITLICDKDRLLPATDPFGRQIMVGCGAFIELAVIAAAERGFSVQVELFANGEPASNALPGGSVVARLMLSQNNAIKPDPLFSQIRTRRTNKGSYDSAKEIPILALQQLNAIATSFNILAGVVTDEKRKTAIRETTRASNEIEMTTSATWLESANLLRIGPTEIAQHRDGISIMGTMPRILTSLGMFDRFAVPVRGDSNFKRLAERWLPFETGSGYFWLASSANSRKDQVNAGRAYVRTQLLATQLGIDMHPLSQALQEFPEVRQQYNAMHAILGFDSAKNTIQMMCRIGYAVAPTSHSPRRELAQLIKT